MKSCPPASLRKFASLSYPHPPPHTHLLFLSMKSEDGWLGQVSCHKLTKPPPTTGKVQTVLGNVVGEISQTGILPTLLQCLQTLAL